MKTAYPEQPINKFSKKAIQGISGSRVTIFEEVQLFKMKKKKHICSIMDNCWSSLNLRRENIPETEVW